MEAEMAPGVLTGRPALPVEDQHRSAVDPEFDDTPHVGKPATGRALAAALSTSQVHAR
jgi:hypothetical protein